MPEEQEEKTTSEIKLVRMGRSQTTIRIEGTAPFISGRFSAKAQQQMLDRQRGIANAKQPKVPEEGFRESLHVLAGEERYGYPATGFKGALVSASRYFSGVTAVQLREVIFVNGESGKDPFRDPGLFVPVEGKPRMREDYVRITGTADIRHRAEFWPWSADLEIIWVRQILKLESLVALVDAAGLGGIGEWRPSSKTSKTGMFGTFKVTDDQDIKEIEL